MENESSTVVSDSTESSSVQSGQYNGTGDGSAADNKTTSTIDTQTEDTSSSQSSEPQTAQERKDYRKLQKEDADLNAHVQREIQRALQKRERQALKQTAKTAAEQGDTVAALTLAQRIASEPDEDEDDSGPHTAQWRQQAERIQPQLDLLLELDDRGQATNPYYVKLYEKVGQKELDRRYAESPTGFARWLNNELTEMRVDDMLRKKAPSLYEAGKLDGQNAALQGAPKPLNGTAAGRSDKWTPSAVARLTPAEYKANRDKIINDLFG